MKRLEQGPKVSDLLSGTGGQTSVTPTLAGAECARSILRAAIVCVSLIANVAQAQTEELPTPADFRDGERWVWRQIDDFTHLEQFRWGRNVVMAGDLPKFRTGGKEHSLEEVYAIGFGPAGYHVDPAKPWRRWPLAVGRSWKYGAEYVSEAGTSGWTTQTATVVTSESVTVPAGTFMAFRIEHKGFWHSSDIRNEVHQGTAIDTYWYAPDVKTDVKHVRASGGNHFTQELVSFRPAAP